LLYLDHKLSEEKLGLIVDTIFIGLGRDFEVKLGSREPHIKIVT